EPGKIGQRSGQPVDLVDDDDVDAAAADIGKKMLQRRPLQIAAGEPAIIVSAFRRHPALVLLAANISFAGLTLRSERVEFLLQPLLGGFAGVDRAPLASSVNPRHCWP